MRVDFYHLEKSSLDAALPKLLEKAVAKHKILIQTDMADRSDYLNGLLWTYDPDSFLPHAVEKDGFPESQPIFITHKSDFNPASADILVLIDGRPVPPVGKFDRVLYFFNGRDEEALQKARQEWKRLKDEEVELFYWQQDESGHWQQK